MKILIAIDGSVNGELSEMDLLRAGVPGTENNGADQFTLQLVSCVYSTDTSSND